VTSPQLVRALIAASAAENAAVYGYSVAGARLTSSDKGVARTAYDAHRAQTLVITQWLAQASATPDPDVPVYQLPSPVTDVSAARAVLASIEESTAAAYADVIAAADASLRRDAALALQLAAVRAAIWRDRAAPFPGLAGRLGL